MGLRRMAAGGQKGMDAMDGAMAASARGATAGGAKDDGSARWGGW